VVKAVVCGAAVVPLEEQWAVWRVECVVEQPGSGKFILLHISADIAILCSDNLVVLIVVVLACWLMLVVALVDLHLAFDIFFTSLFFG
jgi:hypothetical protein